MAESLNGKRAKIDKDGHQSIITLPLDLGLEILGRVASHSIEDICSVKATCKDLVRLAENDLVYKKSTLQKFTCMTVESASKKKPFVHRVDNRCHHGNGHKNSYLGPLYEFVLSPEEIYSRYRQSLFLRRCRESGNLEHLYREGMVIYFQQSCCISREKLGRNNLENAAMNDHMDAKYVFSILLMVDEDMEQRNKGFDMFCDLKKMTDIVQCRKWVRSFIRGMWGCRRIPTPQNISWCNPTICRQIKADDVKNYLIACEYCSADNEIILFCDF